MCVCVRRERGKEGYKEEERPKCAQHSRRRYLYVRIYTYVSMYVAIYVRYVRTYVHEAQRAVAADYANGSQFDSSAPQITALLPIRLNALSRSRAARGPFIRRRSIRISRVTLSLSLSRLFRSALDSVVPILTLEF